MADHKHALAELLRDELILRFMGRSLNASPAELLQICNSFLYEFRKYPDEVLEHAIKSMRVHSADEIADTHLFNFFKRKISEYFGTQNIDDLIFEAALSRETQDGKKYHTFIEKIVDNLPEDKIRMVREQARRMRA